MNLQPMEIKSGIFLFKGIISRNLMLEPMVSNIYLFEDGDDVTIFDPSCGKKIAKKVEAHIRARQKDHVKWERAFIIAGHSHMDHANNFYLSNIIGAAETHIYVHENGFKDGKVMNDPILVIENMLEESKRYYNPYLAYPFPYNLFMYPFSALDAIAPMLTRKLFSLIGGIPWPPPIGAYVEPEPLKECNLLEMNLGGVDIQGWKLGNKVILPTPGHSPCSVSLVLPEQKTLCVCDADWIANPVAASGSIKGCISSLKKLKALSEALKIETLLPAHGIVKEGVEQVLSYLDFVIQHLQVMRNEVLAAYHSSGYVKDVRQLTRVLTQESPIFRMLKLANYPRMVVFVHNVVAVCLREEGILD